MEVRKCGNTWMYCDGNCGSCPYNTTSAVDTTPLRMSGVTNAKLEYGSSRIVQYVELSQEMIDKIADAVVRRIKDERTNEPERKKGEWISDRLCTTNGGTYGVRRCSECEAYYQDVGYGWNYCPHCGADMRGKDVLTEEDYWKETRNEYLN